MSEVTLKKVYINTASKDGKPYKQPRVVIKFDVFGKEESASAFLPVGSSAHRWKQGDVVNVEFEQKGDFLNFTPVVETESRSAGKPPTDKAELRLLALETRVSSLEARESARDVVEDPSLPSDW